MEQKQNQDIIFNIEKIYIKDVSYEAPGVPMVFTQSEAREVNIQLGIAHTAINAEHNLFEVVLTVTALAKRENQNMFLVEIKQAGIFRIAGIADELLQKALEVTCPEILLPFARESINDFVTRGGFAQLLINPINFEMLYEQKHASEQKQAQH